MVIVYEILYTSLETFDAETVNTTEMTANLLDLEEFVNYNISVRAYNTERIGPYSEEVTVRTLEDGKLRMIVSYKFRMVILFLPL